MELLIGIGIFFAVCWVIGWLRKDNTAVGGLANIIYWIYRKAWVILAILLIVGIFLGL